MVVQQAFADLEKSLDYGHPSVNVHTNPVLFLLNYGKLNASRVEEILSQYSLLPFRIVEFLSRGAERLQDWKSVHTELRRNINEEEGSRTDGKPHYVILKDALQEELGLDVSHVHPEKGTERFLNAIEKGLSERQVAVIAGMLYALEDSAVPELAVVASIINKYASLTGHPEPIELSVLLSRKRNKKVVAKATKKYSLDSFFASHMLDFEIGHKTLLASALQDHLSEADIRAFKEGFEYALDEMDLWWKSLATTEGQTNTDSPDNSFKEEENLVLI